VAHKTIGLFTFTPRLVFIIQVRELQIVCSSK